MKEKELVELNAHTRIVCVRAPNDILPTKNPTTRMRFIIAFYCYFSSSVAWRLLCVHVGCGSTDKGGLEKKGAMEPTDIICPPYTVHTHSQTH